MPDNIDDAIAADNNTDASEHLPTPPVAPSIKRHENSEGGDGEDGSSQIRGTEDEVPHWTRYVEAFCTLALVLITGTYTYYAARQARAATDAATAAIGAVTVASNTLMETQRANARQQAISDQARKDDKIVTDRSARDTASALKQTIDNFHKDQRAWIGISQASAPPPTPNGGFQFNVEISNTGKTPALYVVQQAAWTLVPASPAFDPRPLIRHLKPVPDGIIFPGGKGELGQKMTTPVTPQQAAEVATKSKLFYVYGVVTYNDAFGAPHHLRFCLRLLPDGTFVADHPYNTAD